MKEKTKVSNNNTIKNFSFFFNINITNVKKAVELVNPYAIDLSSGVEELPGKKDYQKMEELMRYLRVE